VVAAGWPAILKSPGLENINLDLQIDGLCHLQQEIGKEGSGWAASDHSYSRSVAQVEITLIVLN
jgi:hypothetical protein